MEAALPGPAPLEGLVVGRRPRAWMVGRKPRAQLVAESLFLGGGREVHQRQCTYARTRRGANLVGLGSVRRSRSSQATCAACSTTSAMASAASQSGPTAT